MSNTLYTKWLMRAGREVFGPGVVSVESQDDGDDYLFFIHTTNGTSHSLRVNKMLPVTEDTMKKAILKVKEGIDG